jgi:hypothetical protein
MAEKKHFGALKRPDGIEVQFLKTESPERGKGIAAIVDPTGRRVRSDYRLSEIEMLGEGDFAKGLTRLKGAFSEFSVGLFGNSLPRPLDAEIDIRKNRR